MNTKIERTLAGDFRAHPLGAGAWHLTTEVPGYAEVYVAGSESDAAQKLERAGTSAVRVVWSLDGASLTLICAQGARSLWSRAAIIHEPCPHLYDGLPLVTLDAAARRFWRRVFWLVRMPGGRLLLGLIARRAGGPK